jgi:hypothetical protein
MRGGVEYGAAAEEYVAGGCAVCDDCGRMLSLDII